MSKLTRSNRIFGPLLDGKPIRNAERLLREYAHQINTTKTLKDKNQRDILKYLLAQNLKNTKKVSNQHSTNDKYSKSKANQAFKAQGVYQKNWGKMSTNPDKTQFKISKPNNLVSEYRAAVNKARYIYSKPRTVFNIYNPRPSLGSNPKLGLKRKKRSGSDDSKIKTLEQLKHAKNLQKKKSSLKKSKSSHF